MSSRLSDKYPLLLIEKSCKLVAEAEIVPDDLDVRVRFREGGAAMGSRRLAVAAIVLISGLAVSIPGHLASLLPPEPRAVRQTTAGPTPTPDRLAPPPMLDNPTMADTGAEVYYYHCSPCHGDRGQGLTDEWRAVWVEDHQNCWARGCHGGRVEDQGFPIPKTIPAVVDQPPVLGDLGSLESLTQFLAANTLPKPGELRAVAIPGPGSLPAHRERAGGSAKWA